MRRNEAAGLDRETTLRGRSLVAARVLWLAIAVLVVGLYIAALPYDLQELQRVCSGDDCRVDVQLTGPDALEFTNLLTPRDLTQCEVGQGKYAIITTQEGGIVNDPVLSRLEDNHFWLAPADSDLILWAKGVAVNSGLQVEIKRAESWPVQVQGAKSKEVMAALFGDEILELPYYHIEQTNLNGIPVVVARTGWTGELG